MQLLLTYKELCVEDETYFKLAQNNLTLRYLNEKAQILLLRLIQTTSQLSIIFVCGFLWSRLLLVHILLSPTHTLLFFLFLESLVSIACSYTRAYYVISWHSECIVVFKGRYYASRSFFGRFD